MTRDDWIADEPASGARPFWPYKVVRANLEEEFRFNRNFFGPAQVWVRQHGAPRVLVPISHAHAVRIANVEGGSCRLLRFVPEQIEDGCYRIHLKRIDLTDLVFPATGRLDGRRNHLLLEPVHAPPSERSRSRRRAVSARARRAAAGSPGSATGGVAVTAKDRLLELRESFDRGLATMQRIEEALIDLEVELGVQIETSVAASAALSPETGRALGELIVKAHAGARHEVGPVSQMLDRRPAPAQKRKRKPTAAGVETRNRILLALRERPGLSAREVATRAEISLGKAQFHLRALLNEALIEREGERNMTRYSPPGSPPRVTDYKGIGMVGIARLARDLTDAHDRLTATLDEIEEARNAALRDKLRPVQQQLDAVSRRRQKLHDAVRANENLFDKPKTRVQNGLKFGWHKDRDTLEGNEETAIARIKSLMPEDRVPHLVKAVESLKMPAVRGLSRSELETIGMKVVKGQNRVLIKRVGTDLDRQLKALGAELEALS